MGLYRVFKSPKFQKNVEKLLDKKELDELNTFIDELKAGKVGGKPLTYDFLREKKIGGKRIYFLVYDDIAVILLVNSSNKKRQQETINEIKFFLPEFKREIYRQYRKKD
jgi:putative component of toxin-antitoxin plasmid stabilization module